MDLILSFKYDIYNFQMNIIILFYFSKLDNYYSNCIIKLLFMNAIKALLMGRFVDQKYISDHCTKELFINNLQKSIDFRK